MPLRGHGQFSVDQVKVDLASIADVFGAVVGDIEVEGAVAVDVGQGQRETSVRTGGAGIGGHVGELPPSIILKAAHALAEHRNQQIQRAISIHVSEYGGAIKTAWAHDTGFRGDILELPVAQVAIEAIGGVEATEIKVRQSVVVKVPRGQAGAAEKSAIGRGGKFVEHI